MLSKEELYKEVRKLDKNAPTVNLFNRDIFVTGLNPIKVLSVQYNPYLYIIECENFIIKVCPNINYQIEEIRPKNSDFEYSLEVKEKLANLIKEQVKNENTISVIVEISIYEKLLDNLLLFDLVQENIVANNYTHRGTQYKAFSKMVRWL